MPMQVIVEHVRSLFRKQRIPLRPLTLLVGENSSGKSTFLAIVSCLFDALRFPGQPGFNDPPYNLGTFDTIATQRAGRRQDDFFSIGFWEQHTGSALFREAVATYRSDYGNAVLQAYRASNQFGKLALKLSEARLSGTAALAERGQESITIDFEERLGADSLLSRHALTLEYVAHLMAKSKPKGGSPHALELIRTAKLPFPNCFSFAPIRSKPRRTYDEFSEEYNPEGDHVPTLLAKLLKEERASAEGQRLHQALIRFGKDSGLFKRIEVKRLGKKASDPFQVQVAVNGAAANLADVGYGVSQVLPIIVQSVLRTTSKAFLLQQPEVHLHPRAQAALGSFFCDLVADDRRMMLIETHSDYLIDRVRQEVARGNLNHDKVQILFFHKPHLETTVYPVTIDNNGNVCDAPEIYRQFFLEEEMNLLTRTSI